MKTMREGKNYICYVHLIPLTIDVPCLKDAEPQSLYFGMPSTAAAEQRFNFYYMDSTLHFMNRQVIQVSRMFCT